MISVVMPAYNRENIIKEAINSVLGQTYEDIELIVVDVVCKIIDEVSFAGADSVMHGTIEKMAEH